MDQNGISSLLGLLNQNAGNGKSFSDLLKERRQFIESQGNQLASTVNDQVQNGSNGVPVNPVAAKSDLNDFYATGQNGTNALINTILPNLVQQQGNQLNAGVTIRGQNLQYTGDPGGGSAYSDSGAPSGSDSPQNPLDGLTPKQAEAVISGQGGQDLLDQFGANDPARLQLIRSIQAAGGVPNYRANHTSPMTPGAEASVLDTNNTLKEITQVQEQLATSPKLQKFLNNQIMNPVNEFVLQTFGVKGLQSLNGLSNQDTQALSLLLGLNAKGERQMIGGSKLSTYLSQKLNNAQPGFGLDAKGNQDSLNRLSGELLHSIQTYTKQKGYKTIDDIPGMKGLTVAVKDKKSGQYGPIPISEYDPNLYQ